MTIRKMKKWISKLLGILVVVFGVTFLSFSMMYLSPGDPAETILQMGGNLPSQADIDAKREEMGLNRPLLVQYGEWVGDLLHGDLGQSMITGKNVSKEIGDAVGYTIVLAVFSLLFGVAIAVPVGILTAIRQNGAFDRITLFIIFIRLSMPSFLVSIGLLYVFAYRLKMVSIMSSTAGAAGVILPTATLASGIAARLIRQIRGLVTDEMNEAYVDGARSRGISESRILFGHVLKNVMVPVITLIALAFGGLLGGTAVTEIIFSWPGIGKLALEGIRQRDYTIVQGFVVLTSLIFMAVYGLTEWSYTFFNPALRKGKEGDVK